MKRPALRSWPLAAVIAVSGCQMIAGLTGDYHVATTTSGSSTTHATGGGGSAGAGGTTTATTCKSAGYPDPPTAADGPDLNPIVLAVRSLDIGDTGTVPGYDLDHTCTCIAGAGPTCVSGKSHCDDANGVDNAAAGIFTLLAQGASKGLSSANLSSQAEAGKWTLLVRIQGYNGLADDPAVDVTVFPSPGRDTPPSWNGSDVWPVDDKSVGPTGLSDPLYKSQGAYVSQGVLVAAMPVAKIVLVSDSVLGVRFIGGVLTGKLEQAGTSWKVTEGVLAARWALKDVFGLLSGLRVAGAPICTDTPVIYDTVKNTICTGADILADGTSPKSLPCDAISFGLGFTAEQALLGTVAPSNEPSPACPPATDPANDTCPGVADGG